MFNFSPKQEDISKVKNFFNFLKTFNLEEGKDFGEVDKNRFFLSEKAVKIAESPIAIDWVGSLEDNSIPVVDYSSLDKQAKLFVLEIQNKVFKFLRDNDVEIQADLALDIIAGVLSQRSEPWSFKKHQFWVRKLVRFYSIRALDFISIYHQIYIIIENED